MHIGLTLVRNKIPQMEIVLLCFNVLYFLCVVTRIKCFHADVEAARTRGSSPLDRRSGAHFVPQGDDVMG